VLEFSLTHLDVAPDKDPTTGPRATRIVSAAPERRN
jgi:hypothetical protein